MPVSSEYDKEKKVLFITLEGELLLEEVEQLFRDIVASAEYPSDIRSIWDFRRVDFTLIDTDFLEQVFTIRRNFPERGNARAAFVADGDLSFGTSRMYEVLSSFEFPQHIMTFRDFSKAEEWVLAGD